MIWLSLSVMICTIVISAASLRSWRGDALGIPLIAIGTFAFLYVIQPMQLIWAGTYGLFVTDRQMSEGLLVPTLMLPCFIWGWTVPRQAKPRAISAWDTKLIWRFGFTTACIGLILYLTFLGRSGGFAQSYSQVHGGGMAFSNSTAYVYYGPWWMLSGAVMMFLGEQTIKHQKWKSAVPYAFLSVFLLDSILTGGRGGVFAVAITYFVGSSIARRRKVTFSQAALLLLPVCLVVLLMVGYRSFLHLGASTSQNLPSVESAYNITANVSEYDVEHGTSGQEFLYHAVLLSTVDQTRKLDYGLSWIEFFIINPIPRLLWPEKAMPPSIGVTWADISEHTSFTIAPGSAPGIVADLYARFHIFSALFFFGLGFGLRRLFVAARTLSSPVATVGYVMVYALSLNMFAQGFGAIFVPLGYSMIPVVVYSWATRERRRKLRSRQRELILSQVTALHRQRVALHGEQ